MRRVGFLAFALVLLACRAEAAVGHPRTIEFPCLKNLSDGRVLVDGTQWDRKMQELGFVLKDGEYVPYEVIAFTEQKIHDTIWADGLCRMKLLPVAK